MEEIKAPNTLWLLASEIMFANSVDDGRHRYYLPYELPNGDILIRRKVDDQEVEDDGTSPANAEFV